MLNFLSHHFQKTETHLQTSVGAIKYGIFLICSMLWKVERVLLYLYIFQKFLPSVSREAIIDIDGDC